MKIYKQDNMTIHNADCMEIMAQYEDNYFDLAVVDPPYGIGASSMVMGKGKNKKYKNNKEWDNQPPREEYFIELFRVSKNQIIWGGNYFKLPLQSGWLFWDKDRNKNVSFGDGELAWCSSLNVIKKIKLKYDGFLGADDNRIHPTQKPIKLYSYIFNMYAEEGQKILDTHLGSGSNAISAHYAKMHFVGCELDEDYYSASIERIRKETRQLELF